MPVLKTIAERQVYRALRKQRRGNPKSIEALTPTEEQELVDKSPPVAEATATKELWRNALAQLPPVYRRVAILWNEGYTQLEIAAKIGIGERTVRTAITSLREILRKKLE